MVQQNPDLAKVQSDYLFAEIAARKQAIQDSDPSAKIISLGIGDTTEPIPAPIVTAMENAARALGTDKYTGYGSGIGSPQLREAIAKTLYPGMVTPDEVFVSDGSKCDIGRLQLLFGRACPVALQDPSYPAYVGASVQSGKTGTGSNGQYEGIVYMACTPENRFSPDLSVVPPGSVIYLCSPNNPTGTVLTRDQLKSAVAFAKDHHCIVVFDSAYAAFIQDPQLPRSIFEIEGADEVAIETGSFSKRVGFTGVRLGWTVVPKALRFDNGVAAIDDWKRICSTVFNGPCNIAEAGGIAALEPEGLAAQDQLIAFYMENARILRKTVETLGYRCYGGQHTPYLWVDLEGASSWGAFDHLLQEAKVVTTPGVGFGPAGEGYLRLSAFGHRADIEEAAKRLAVLGRVSR